MTRSLNPPTQLALVAALTLLAALGGTVSVEAQELPQASSADTMRRAEGIIFDTSELDPDPHWTFTGPFVLACGPTPCADAPAAGIVFDMTVVMVRPDGAQSHTHSFSQFVGSDVSVVGDTLIIEGSIVGSGAVGGLNDIVIEFRDVGEAGEFHVELLGNGHIVGGIGGVITGSR